MLILMFKMILLSLYYLLIYRTLIVSEATHISGSLIDHVCISNNLMKNFLAERTELISVHFSD